MKLLYYVTLIVLNISLVALWTAEIATPVTPLAEKPIRHVSAPLTSAPKVFSYDISEIRNPRFDVKPGGRDCLIQNVYHEARGEPLRGRESVAWVTLNRVLDKRWPNTICDVVRQVTRKGNRKVSQFSWYGVKSIISEKEAYEEISKMVDSILLRYDNLNDPTKGATHFHTTKVNPKWASKLVKVKTVGRHIFYK